MEITNNSQVLPVLVESDLFLYPFMITPIFLSSKDELELVELAMKKDMQIAIMPSKNNQASGFDGCYKAGVVGNILRRSTMPDGKIKILFQGEKKARICEIISQKPMLASLETLNIQIPNEQKCEALLGILKEKIKALGKVSQAISDDLLRTINDSSDLERICDIVCSALKLKKELAYNFFIVTNIEEKVIKISDYIDGEIEASKLQKEIKSKVHSRIDKVNKEYFLKEQLKEIQRELGSDTNRDEELEEYRKRLAKKKDFMGEDAYKEINKQIERLSRMHPDGSEASMTQGYLDWALDVPFEKLSHADLSVNMVATQLDCDHYGLKKPKERIIEYFALRELLEKRKCESKANKGTILCFVGPPGVGKTSLANSISKALKRKLVRIALGGLEDVNELRGHRRTYIGAMPGRIVQGLIEAKTMNPVVVLDEIDKLARSYRGDPTAVLLEILDPEQNSKFRDYYLNFNIDLAKIVFIATANEVAPIPAPLRDRMEFIQLNSYTPQEKMEIFKKYLLPWELENHGLKASEINISKAAVQMLIEEYTRESGVRNLRRQTANILRKSALKILENGDQKGYKINITPKNLGEFLDKKVYEINPAPKSDKIGIVNGLAWTSVGGDVLRIEAIRIKGSGKLEITGQLGDVMKESAQIARSLIKTLIDSGKLKVPKELIRNDKEGKPMSVYDSYDLHIHVPEGATPKDGPSAGITMSTAIASIFSNKSVRHDVAMTGEITLSGEVLPIGGLKEKLIAAFKAKIKTALIPAKNYERDLVDIPDEVKNGMEIIAVNTISDVLKHALNK